MPLRELTVANVMNRDVLMTGAETATVDALRMMADKGVGAIVIMDGRRPVGMFTERDLLRAIVHFRCINENQPISNVMTTRIISASPDRPVEEAYRRMIDANCRHLLVLDAKKELQGIISIKDLARFRQQALEIEVEKKTREIADVRDELGRSLSMLKKEMSFAGNFQKQLIEKKNPRIKGVRVTHEYQLADSIGGDYFGIVHIDKDHLGILMADVMGHGITSAMIAVEVKLKFDELSKKFDQPGEIITRMNRTLSNLMPPGFFVAGCCSVLNINTWRMSYTHFGLPSPGIYRASSGRFEALKPCQVPIGIKQDAVYPQKEIAFREGDKLLLFTDGCNEQKNIRGEYLGVKRFIAEFRRLADSKSTKIVSGLYRYIQNFSGGTRRHSDDVAILLFEFKKRANGSKSPRKKASEKDE